MVDGLYIGVATASTLTPNMRFLLAGIINRRGSGEHPVATPDGLAYFGCDYAVACIDRAMPDLNDPGQELARDVRAILNGDTLGVCTRCGERLSGDIAEIEPAAEPPVSIIIHESCRVAGDLEA